MRRLRKSKREKIDERRGRQIARLKKSLLIAGFIVIGLPLLFLGTDTLINWGKIRQGVTVNGIPVGRLDQVEATKKITTELKRSLSQPLKLKYKKHCWDISAEDLGVQLNAAKSAARAFQVGRSEPFWQRLKIRFLSWFRPTSVKLVYSVDKQKLENMVEQISKSVYKPPQDSTIKIEQTKATLVPSQIGIAVNRPQLINLLMTKIVSIEKRTALLPVTIVPVKITEKEARQALEDAKVMMAQPVLLKYNENNWTISEIQIASLIEFKVVEQKAEKKKAKSSKYLLCAGLNRDKTIKLIDDLTQDIRVEPKNAQFKVSGPNVTIIPSQNGLAVDSAVAYQSLSKVVLSRDLREIVLSSKVLTPEITTEKASAMGIKTRVSIFTTDYNPSQTSRVNNIHLLADALDGAIVPPNGIFSFNDQIGPRTAEKGYQKAPTIIQGEMTMTVGGGICQVGTTLFNAIFFGGYPIVERHNHSFYISRYPTGRDATVSYGSLDLKFKNNTSAYILIKTWYTASTLTIALYSTDFDIDVSYKTSEFTNFVPFPLKYVDDPTLPKGTQVVEEEGIEGRDVTVYRTVKRSGTIVLEDKFFSRYKPKRALIRNGTMEVPTPAPSSETTPTP